MQRVLKHMLIKIDIKMPIDLGCDQQPLYVWEQTSEVDLQPITSLINRGKLFILSVCSHRAYNGMIPLLAKSVSNLVVVLNSSLTKIAQSSLLREHFPDSFPSEKTPPHTLCDWGLERWSSSPCMSWYQTPDNIEDCSRTRVALSWICPVPYTLPWSSMAFQA